MLRQIADQIIEILYEMPEVKHCSLYGSLANHTCDDLSDIDINIDVSGYDNGQFMLMLTDRFRKHIPIYYSDYAPSLVPEKYIVSIAIDENHPTRVVDLCCVAQPHCTTITKQQVRMLNDEFSHMLKLWTANWKHWIRGMECRNDIIRMAEKIGLSKLETKIEKEILEETLAWLERRAPENLQVFADTTTVQNLEMIPLSELPASWDQTVIFDTPPQNL